MSPSRPPHAPEPLAAFPLFRSQDADEARQQVARVFCPHDLRQLSARRPFASRHNLVQLGETSLNFLTYGTEVDILPGCLDSFYLVQIPLAGSASISCGAQRMLSTPATAAILNPHEPTRMRWSQDNHQLLLHVPRAALERRLAEHLGEPGAQTLAFELALPQDGGLTRAWCRMVIDLAANIDASGTEWLRYRPTIGALEDCLLRGLLQLHRHNYSARLAAPVDAGQPRHVRRAMDYIHAHLGDALTVGDIARAACVSVRALEEGFRRHCASSPLAYLRDARLDGVRRALLDGGPERGSVTEIAHRHGFFHLGRFSAYYKARFGESPSQSARRAPGRGVDRREADKPDSHSG